MAVALEGVEVGLGAFVLVGIARVAVRVGALVRVGSGVDVGSGVRVGGIIVGVAVSVMPCVIFSTWVAVRLGVGLEYPAADPVPV